MNFALNKALVDSDTDFDELGMTVDKVHVPSERTMRTLAKKLAGEFYEATRTDVFRNGEMLVPCYRIDRGNRGDTREVLVKVPFKVAYPNAKAYSRAFWPHYLQEAKSRMVKMLSMPDSRVSPHLKQSIMDALMEHQEKVLKHKTQGEYLLQRNLGQENVVRPGHEGTRR